MRYRPFYPSKILKQLERFDARAKKRIIEAVDWYCEQPDPLTYAKRLTGLMSGSYRFRVGDHRVTFDLLPDGQVTLLYILRVGHRKNVYRT